MARKTTPTPPSEPYQLTMQREDAYNRLEGQIAKGSKLQLRSIGSPQELEMLERDFHDWDAYNAELLRRMFTTSEVQDTYTFIGVSSFSFGTTSLQEELTGLRESVGGRIGKLSSIKNRLDLIPVSSGAEATPVPRPASRADLDNKIFLVHGSDEVSREMVARLIEKIGLSPVILHEQVNKGRTVIEKLEGHGNTGFAIVILTPDDVGGKKNESEKHPRARQNVILELGYFIGRLGRERVCALRRGEIETPSDIVGIVYTLIDEGGGWRLKLAQELKAAGYTVDLNAL